jgi:hypothetical protein
MSTTAVYAKCIVAAQAGCLMFTREATQQNLEGHEFDALFTVSYSADANAQGKVIVNVVDNTNMQI